MSYQIYSIGTLAEHRRQKILQQAVGAESARSLPDSSGLCLMFGSDFQAATVDAQKDWLAWTGSSGNCLLLVPPFGIGKTALPVEWEAVPVSGVKTEETTTLAKTLVSEVRYEIVGRLQTAKEVGGLWERHIVHTAYYRRHPHAGLLAVTALPVWSLGALERKDRLRKFLDDLYELAGDAPTAAEIAEAENDFAPAPHHYTVLLHLLTGDFADAAHALDALETSEIFNLEREKAAATLAELNDAGYAGGGKITAKGREILEQSDYRIFAEELINN